jgi:hypothetical protein
VRPNLVRVPVAVTMATASPRRTSAPANVSWPRPGFHGQRLTGQHRLVEQHFAEVDAHVGRNHAAKRQHHDIAGRDLFGRQIAPSAVAAHACPQRQPRFQRQHGCLRAALVEQAEPGVEDD